jgi:hypothetical protein
VVDDLDSLLHLYQSKISMIDREIHEIMRMKPGEEDLSLVKYLNIKLEIYQEFVKNIEGIDQMN